MVRQYPAFVAGVVHHSVVQWRWRRAESMQTPTFSNGFGRGPAWRPIKAGLKLKDSKDWGPEQKGALRSLVMGLQWTQQRLHAAGLVQDSRCRLCLGHVNGNRGDTLLHRHVCLALTKFRDFTCLLGCRVFCSLVVMPLGPRCILCSQDVSSLRLLPLCVRMIILEPLAG